MTENQEPKFSRERIALRQAARTAYDIQELRCANENRAKKKGGKAPKIELTKEHLAANKSIAHAFKDTEKAAMEEMVRRAKVFPIYNWLRRNGAGEIASAFMLAEFSIERADRPSAFWQFAGLGAEKDGSRQRPIAGQRLSYNSRLRAKVIAILGGSFLKNGKRVATGATVEVRCKACSDEPTSDDCGVCDGTGKIERAEQTCAGHPVYRPFYDQVRHRRQTQLGRCMLCEGTGKARQPKKDENGFVTVNAGKLKTCWNCVANTDGSYTPMSAPWGRGDAHRHADAMRQTVKLFLLNFWKAWRAAEGLPICESYNEARRGYRHGDASGGTA
jgi:hypothetical protein